MKQNDKTVGTKEIFDGGSGFNAAKSSFQISGKEKEITSFDKDFSKKSDDNSLNSMVNTQDSSNFAKKSKGTGLSISKFESGNLDTDYVEELGSGSKCDLEYD
jgi:hypothetical protein